MSDKVEGAISRWLRRPYVAHRRTMNPRLTNFAALLAAVLVELVTVLLWAVVPIDLPAVIVLTPIAVMLAVTAAHWLREPIGNRYAYDD